MKRTTLGISFLLTLVIAAVAAFFACVPADTRPVPGSLFLTVGASDATRNGVVTADGWTLSFERVLVGAGRTTLTSSCARYSESSYDRVLELSKRGPQKLSVLYAIGRCDLRFRVGQPSSEALLGEGTTEADRTSMRTRSGDRWVRRGGIVLDVTGAARRGAEEKAFRFVFRATMRFSGCSEEGASRFVGDEPDAGDDDEPDASPIWLLDAATDGEPPPPEGIGVRLVGGVDVVMPLTFEVEELFRAGEGAPLRFDPFAEADLDQSGTVTLEELAAVPITRVRDGGAFVSSTYTSVTDAGGGRAVVVASLGDYLYIVALPRLLRYAERGACAVGLGLDRGGDGGSLDAATDADADAGTDADAATDADTATDAASATDADAATLSGARGRMWRAGACAFRSCLL